MTEVSHSSESRKHCQNIQESKLLKALAKRTVH